MQSIVTLSVLLNGDIHVNPEPVRKAKYPCTVCERGVIKTSNAVTCDTCEKKTHARCLPFSNKHASYMCNQYTINTLTIDDKQELSFTSNNLPETDPAEQSNSKLPSTISSDNFECFK